MKLHYFWNDLVYIAYDANYSRIGGHWHTLNQVKYYAKKYGWNGVKKVDYNFVCKAFDVEQQRHAMNAKRTD